MSTDHKSAAMPFLDPFQILLNNLSNELDHSNLQSLIHVCGKLIPGGQREHIKTGWDVFSILRHQNAIGEDREKIAFLLRITKELRPKRRDLVCMVKHYIEEHYEQPRTILDQFESSVAGEKQVPTAANQPRECIASDEYSRTGCIIHCGSYFNCSCSPCCEGFFCCVILAILFAFLAVLIALLWYCHVSPRDYALAGIVICGFLAACCASCGVYLKTRRSSILSSRVKMNNSIFNSASNQTTVYGSFITSNSIQISRPNYYPQNQNDRSSSQSTASASNSLQPCV